MSKHWVESEDKILKENYDLGKSWFEISLLLPTRNAKAVKRRWYYINRMMFKVEI